MLIIPPWPEMGVWYNVFHIMPINHLHSREIKYFFYQSDEKLGRGDRILVRIRQTPIKKI